MIYSTAEGSEVGRGRIFIEITIGRGVAPKRMRGCSGFTVYPTFYINEESC
jgi:hypothetical protein